MSTENTTPSVESAPAPAAPEQAVSTSSTPSSARTHSTPTVTRGNTSIKSAPETTPEIDWLGSIDSAIQTGLKSDETPSSDAEVDETSAASEEEKPAQAEEFDEDSEKLPPMTKAAGAKFKQLKSDIKTWKQKVSELEQQLAERTPEIPEDYEELKTKLNEYEKEVAVSRVESSAQFKQAVITPLNGILAAAYSMAARYEVPEAAMEAMLQESDPVKQDSLLQEVVSGFSERDRLNLYRLVDDVGVVLMRREEILSQASEARKYLVEQEREKSITEHKTAMDSVWKVLSDKVPIFADKKVAEEVRNKAMGANLLEARPDVRAYAAYSGAVLPHLLKQNQSLSTKVAELEKTLAGIRKTVPRPGKGHSVQSETPSDVGFLEALEAQL